MGYLGKGVSKVERSHYLKLGLGNAHRHPLSLPHRPSLLMVWPQGRKMSFEQRGPRDRNAWDQHRHLFHRRDRGVCSPGQSCGSPISLMSSCGLYLGEDVWGPNGGHSSLGHLRLRDYRGLQVPPVYSVYFED